MDLSIARILSPLQRWQDTWSPAAKVGRVLAGYVVAVALAAAGVGCHLLLAYYLTGLKDYSGMNAFGDELLFLAIFAVASIPATVAALFFLRSCPRFWTALAGVAAAGACAAIVSSVFVVAGSRSQAAGIGFLVVLAAPLFALAYGIAGLLATERKSRVTLLAAAAIDGLAFAAWFLSCIIRTTH